MRKFVCEKITKAEIREGRIILTFERICLELSVECATAVWAMLAAMRLKTPSV